MLFGVLRDLIQQDSANEKILSYFEENEQHLTLYDESNHLALYYLLTSDYAHLVIQLIKKYPSIISIYIHKELKYTPLCLAAYNGLTEVVKALLAAGADKDKARSDIGATPLYVAAQKGHTKVVNALLVAGADKDKARSDDGSTPLFIAAQNGYIEVVNALLEAGAKKDKARSDDGSTPLFIAAQEGYTKVVKALLAAGADKDKATSDDGLTPLYVAAQNGHIEVVNALLVARADVNKSLNDGATPLFIAVKEGHADVVKELLAAGADISLAYRNNRTLLHHASINKQSEIVKVLAAHPSTTLEMLQALENDTHITSQIKDILSEAIQERMDFAESNPVCQTALKFWPQCPISLQHITDPVVAEDGYTYERAFIEQWFQTQNTSPITRQPLRANTLIKNRQALDTINKARKVIDSAYKEHKTPKPPAASSLSTQGMFAAAKDASDVGMDTRSDENTDDKVSRQP